MKKMLNGVLLIFVAASGCTTKSGARAQSQAAYNAGRAAAYQQALEEQRTNIRIIGKVRNPEIPWADGMTLMEALVQANCTDSRNPREIFFDPQAPAYPCGREGIVEGRGRAARTGRHD